MYVLIWDSKTPDAPIIGYTAYLVAPGPPKKAVPRSCHRVPTSALLAGCTIEHEMRGCYFSSSRLLLARCAPLGQSLGLGAKRLSLLAH